MTRRPCLPSPLDRSWFWPVQHTRTCVLPCSSGGTGPAGASHQGRAPTATYREGQRPQGPLTACLLLDTGRGRRGAAGRFPPPGPAAQARPGRAAPPAPPQHCRHRGRGGALKGPGWARCHRAGPGRRPCGPGSTSPTRSSGVQPGGGRVTQVGERWSRGSPVTAPEHGSAAAGKLPVAAASSAFAPSRRPLVPAGGAGPGCSPLWSRQDPGTAARRRRSVADPALDERPPPTVLARTNRKPPGRRGTTWSRLDPRRCPPPPGERDGAGPGRPSPRTQRGPAAPSARAGATGRHSRVRTGRGRARSPPPNLPPLAAPSAPFSESAPAGLCPGRPAGSWPRVSRRRRHVGARGRTRGRAGPPAPPASTSAPRWRGRPRDSLRPVPARPPCWRTGALLGERRGARPGAYIGRAAANPRPARQRDMPLPGGAGPPRVPHATGAAPPRRSRARPGPRGCPPPATPGRLLPHTAPARRKRLPPVSRRLRGTQGPELLQNRVPRVTSAPQR